MTPPVPPPEQAPGDGLREAIARTAYSVLSGGDPAPRLEPAARLIADALLAGPLAPVLAALAQVAAERDKALQEVDLVRDDSSEQMAMLDCIAEKLGLAHDEGLDDVEPFLTAIDRIAESRAADLAAENVRLREALERIAEEHDAGRHDGLPEPCPAHEADMMWAIARTALTEPRHDR